MKAGISLSELLWLSLTALLYDRTSARCVARAEALATVSHDRLTSMVQADWSGPTLREVACRTLFVWERGALMIDATGLANPLANAMEGLAWVVSSRARQPVSGLALVLLVWTTGPRRLPLGMRRWRPGGPAKSELALE